MANHLPRVSRRFIHVNSCDGFVVRVLPMHQLLAVDHEGKHKMNLQLVCQSHFSILQMALETMQDLLMTVDYTTEGGQSMNMCMLT